MSLSVTDDINIDVSISAVTTAEWGEVGPFIEEGNGLFVCVFVTVFVNRVVTSVARIDVFISSVDLTRIDDSFMTFDNGTLFVLYNTADRSVDEIVDATTVANIVISVSVTSVAMASVTVTGDNILDVTGGVNDVISLLPIGLDKGYVETEASVFTTEGDITENRNEEIGDFISFITDVDDEDTAGKLDGMTCAIVLSTNVVIGEDLAETAAVTGVLITMSGNAGVETGDNIPAVETDDDNDNIDVTTDTGLP